MKSYHFGGLSIALLAIASAFADDPVVIHAGEIVVIGQREDPATDVRDEVGALGLRDARAMEPVLVRLMHRLEKARSESEQQKLIAEMDNAIQEITKGHEKNADRIQALFEKDLPGLRASAKSKDANKAIQELIKQLEGRVQKLSDGRLFYEVTLLGHLLESEQEQNPEDKLKAAEEALKKFITRHNDRFKFKSPELMVKK